MLKINWLISCLSIGTVFIAHTMEEKEKAVEGLVAEEKPSIWLKSSDGKTMEIGPEIAKYIQYTFFGTQPYSTAEAVAVPFNNAIIQLLIQLIPKAAQLQELEKKYAKNPENADLKNSREAMKKDLLQNSDSLIDLYKIANYLHIDGVRHVIMHNILDIIVHNPQHYLPKLTKNIGDSLFESSHQELKKWAQSFLDKAYKETYFELSNESIKLSDQEKKAIEEQDRAVQAFTGTRLFKCERNKLCNYQVNDEKPMLLECFSIEPGSKALRMATVNINEAKKLVACLDDLGGLYITALNEKNRFKLPPQYYRYGNQIPVSCALSPAGTRVVTGGYSKMRVFEPGKIHDVFGIEKDGWVLMFEIDHPNILPRAHWAYQPTFWSVSIADDNRTITTISWSDAEATDAIHKIVYYLLDTQEREKLSINQLLLLVALAKLNVTQTGKESIQQHATSLLTAFESYSKIIPHFGESLAIKYGLKARAQAAVAAAQTSASQQSPVEANAALALLHTALLGLQAHTAS